jgi:hypothetical protein
MPLLDLTLQHGRTLEEARGHLETAVNQISGRFGSLVRRVEWNRRFGSLVRRVEWNADHSRAKLDGVGFSVEMWVDAQAVHATGDVPFLGGLLGSSLAAGLKQIMQLTFRNKLP